MEQHCQHKIGYIVPSKSISQFKNEINDKVENDTCWKPL